METHPLTSVRANTSLLVHEASSVVDREMSSSMAGERIVALPLVSQDDRSESHVLLDESKECVMIPFVPRALDEEAVTSSLTVSTENPLAEDSPTSVKLPLAELRLINLNDVAQSTNLRSSSVLIREVFSHALS